MGSGAFPFRRGSHKLPPLDGRDVYDRLADARDMVQEVVDLYIRQDTIDVCNGQYDNALSDGRYLARLELAARLIDEVLDHELTERYSPPARRLGP